MFVFFARYLAIQALEENAIVRASNAPLSEILMVKKEA
jgi:hypothetical protein